MVTSSQSTEAQPLQRSANAAQIWVLAVGTVISGEFFGWNYGLRNGFWSLFGAMILATVLYTGLLLAVLELGSIFPRTGAAYVFAYQAMGPLGGFLSGLAEYMEYQVASVTVAVGIGRMLNQMVPQVSEPIWWAINYVLVCALDFYGVQFSFGAQTGVLILACCTLLVFYGSVIPQVDFRKWLGVSEGEAVFPSGWAGVLFSMPYAMWFYLGVEAIPFATEETKNPGRSLPLGGLIGSATLLVMGFATLVLNSAVEPGPHGLVDSPAPLSAALKPIWGEGWLLNLFTFAGLTGMFASFQGLVYTTARQIYSGAQAGFFPKFFTLTSKKKTPFVAVITTGCIGWLLALLVYVLGKSSLASATLLNMSVFGALLSYAAQLISFMLLRVRAPGIKRPFKNPLGIWGVSLALIITIISFGSLFLLPEYRWAMVGGVIWFFMGILYCLIFKRHLFECKLPDITCRPYEQLENAVDHQDQGASQQGGL